MAHSEPVQKVRPTKTDERLLIEAAQGDRARFADIYEEYFELVYAYVARRVRDRSTAEDLASDVFHKALANLPKFKWTGAPFASWLFRIASNLIADRAKLAARASETSLDQSGAAEGGSSPTPGSPAGHPGWGGAIRKGAATPLLTRGPLPRSASTLLKTQQADLEEAERCAVL